MKTYQKLLWTLTKGIGILVSYRMLYRLKYPLIQRFQPMMYLDELQVSDSQIELVNEKDYHIQMAEQVLPYLKQKSHRVELGNGREYHYYGGTAQNQTIVIVHGFNEFHHKYDEMVYYFLQMGFNVLTYDAIGHGFSKANEDIDVVDIHNFNDYISDLHQIINHARKKFAIIEPLYLFGHSMGGAVALSYTHDYPDQVEKLILSSPMLNIDTSPLSRPLTHLFAASARILNVSGRRIPFQKAKGIDIRQTYVHNPGLSHCDQRAIYSHTVNRFLHHKPTQGGTLRWLHCSLRQMQKMSRQSYLAAIHCPVLIFMSTNDRVVRNDGIINAANFLQNVQLVAVKDAGHELYQEHDRIVHSYIKLIEVFLKRDINEI